MIAEWLITGTPKTHLLLKQFGCFAPIAKSHNVSAIIAAYCMPRQLPLIQ